MPGKTDRKGGSSGGKKMKSSAAAGKSTGAKSRRNQQPQPATSNNSKMLMFGVGVVLLIAAIVALVLATGGSDSFQVSQEQFSGDIQFDDSDEEIIQWDDEFNNVNSPKAKALIEKVKPGIISALEAEGFDVDNLDIESMTPGEETTVEHAEKIPDSELGHHDQEHLQDTLQKYGSSFEGRSRNERSHLRGTGQAFYKTKIYTNVKPVNVKFKSYGTPSKNAAIMGSSNFDTKTVNKLQPAISARLGSVGLRARVKKFEPKPNFISAVEKVVSKNPVVITTTQPPQQSAQEIDACSTLGAIMYRAEQAGQTIFTCAQTCKESTHPFGQLIFGGFEDIYNSFTRACTAAYASSFIDDDANGIFEILAAGVGPSKNRTEPIQGNWITQEREPIMSKLYRLKQAGGVITPTLPPTTQPPSNQNFRFSTTTANRWVKTEPQVNKLLKHGVEDKDTLMVIYVRCYVPSGSVNNPSDFYSDSSTSKGKKYVDDIITPVLEKIADYGFTGVNNAGLFQSYQDNWFAFLITIDGEDNFVEVIKKMNGMQHQSFQMQMEQDFRSKKKRQLGSVRLTKKGRDLLMA